MKTFSGKSATARRGDGWFSSPTAWRAEHFDDAGWRPCLVATFGFAGLTLFALTGLAGDFARILTVIGLLGLAFCLRVVYGKITAKRPHDV